MRAVLLIASWLTGCVIVRVSTPRAAPVYECAAEDGSGRTVRVAYAGDPVRLSEGLADEPGGLWSCWPTAYERGQSLPSAHAVLLGLSLAASTNRGARCSPYPWRPLRLQECR